MAASTLDEPFERHAESHYTREPAFSTLVRLMVRVVLRGSPSLHAAHREDGDVAVSTTSVCNKLNGVEPAVAVAPVAETAGALRAVVEALHLERGRLTPPLARE